MLACMCDLIVCDESARFGNPVGLMALAGVQLLVEPWEVGARKAKELLFTGDVVDAEEALRIGLVNHVVAPDDVLDYTLAMAQRVADNSQQAVQAIKRTVDLALPIDTALTLESEANRRIRASNESAERFKAAAAKVVGPS